MNEPRIERRGLLASALVLGGAAWAGRARAADPDPTQPAALKVAPTSQAGASPRLTFHAVDTFYGATGAGLELQLSRFDAGEWKLMKSVKAVQGGRTAEPLLIGDDYRPGRYEVLMDVGSYFQRLGAQLPKAGLPVPRAAANHHPRRAGQRIHLPVLFSPWGYSFYRGS